MTEHRQWQVKRRLSAYTESPMADDRDHYHPSAHNSLYYGAVPPVSRMSRAATRRISMAAAPIPFTETLAARSSDCGCCSCLAAAARAYNASQQAHTAAHPRPVSQAERHHVGPFAATRRTSDSSRNYYVEPHHLEARPTAWVMGRGVVESRHLDLHSANPPSSDDGKRPTKRRRTQQLDHIADASTAWESQERPCPSAASVAGLSHSWATGVIQPAATASSPSSSAPSPSSSSPSSASSPVAPAATADRSSFSWQVVATPLPTLVSTSFSPTVFYLPTTATAADATSATPGMASPSAAAEPDELQTGLEQADDNEGDDQWFGFLLRRAGSETATTTPSPSSSW